MNTLYEISREERFNEDIVELKKTYRNFSKRSRKNTRNNAIMTSIEEGEWL